MKRTIYLITFLSDSQTGSVEERHKDLLEKLRKEYDANLINVRSLGHLRDNAFCLIFISSGGVEHQVLNRYRTLPHPLIFLADENNNSLAASLELLTWANSQSIRSEILLGGDPDIMKKIDMLYKIHETQHALKGKRIGVLGTPANWLVSSNVNYLLAQRRWGVEYVDVALADACRMFAQVSNDEIGELSAAFASKAKQCKDATPDDLLKDVRLYAALQRVIKANGLDALTLNTSRLKESIDTSANVALSMLNNDGIPATGEGDLQGIFTMLMLHELTGEKSFMGNVIDLDVKQNWLTLAHCTISTDMVDNDFILRNHYESDSSVGIQGNMKPGTEVTVAKCGGESLNEYYVSSGITVDKPYSEMNCRTQIAVALKSSVDCFLREPIGNHHVLIRGDYQDIVDAFMRENSGKRIK